VCYGHRKETEEREKRKFGTFTRDLLMLADWLRECGLTHVAMASTGGLLETGWPAGTLRLSITHDFLLSVRPAAMPRIRLA